MSRRMVCDFCVTEHTLEENNPIRYKVIIMRFTQIFNKRTKAYTTTEENNLTTHSCEKNIKSFNNGKIYEDLIKERKKRTNVNIYKSE